MSSGSVAIGTANIGKAEIALATTAPKTGFALASATTSTSNINALDINVTAKDRDITIKSLQVNHIGDDAGTETAATAGLITAVKLYDGSTLIASVSLDGARKVAEFTQLNIPVSKDATKTLTVKIDVPSLSGGLLANEASFRFGYKAMTAVDSSDTFVTSKTGSALGKLQTLYTKAPSLASVSTNITKTTEAGADDRAGATIVFDITAQNGNVYIKKADNAQLTADATAAAFSEAYTYSSTADSEGDYYIIRQNETKRFTVTGSLAGIAGQNVGAIGFVKMFIQSIK